MKDSNDCAVYAVAFTCFDCPAAVRVHLWRAGRKRGDGATDKQILQVIRYYGRTAKVYHTQCKTIRSFARAEHHGTYIVVTSDHVVAVVDGHVCGRVRDSDLMRVEKVWEITDSI